MLKILLIEDNEMNLDLISRYLKLFGYEVSLARDGRSGLQMIQDNPTDLDLLLVDMNLPEIDGWEVARQVKANDATRHLPVIALTAHAMVGDREKALEAGCDEYVTKPIDFDSLFEKIESLCSKHLFIDASQRTRSWNS